MIHLCKSFIELLFGSTEEQQRLNEQALREDKSSDLISHALRAHNALEDILELIEKKPAQARRINQGDVRRIIERTGYVRRKER